jgi:hypothetical protein
MAMLSTELLTELHNLSRAEKLEVVQVLVRDLTIQETALEDDALLTLVSGAHHEVWSPYDAPATAAALTRLLEADQRARDA